jgi:hypothetical protein
MSNRTCRIFEQAMVSFIPQYPNTSEPNKLEIKPSSTKTSSWVSELTLQENWPIPTAIFQTRDSYTYGRLITVTKSRFFTFLFNLNLFYHAFIVLSSHILFIPSFSSLVFTHSHSDFTPRFNLHTHSRLHSSKSFFFFTLWTLNPIEIFTLWTLNPIDSHSLNFVFFFRFSHSMNFIVFFRSQGSFKLQVQHSHSLNLCFLIWLEFELIWFWIKIWMRSYFVVW